MCCCCCCCSDFLGEKMESCIISFLEKRYPGLGLREIVRLLQLVSEKIEEHSHNLNIEEKKDETDLKRNEIEINQDDGKWRPVLLTLGLMYKLQISWVLATHEKSVEEHQTKILESVNSNEIEMVLFHVKDATTLEDQAPDTALIIHHDRQEIVLTICGTKITPAPSMGDIMLDLHCDSIEYLEGKAHEGIAIAAENVLKIFQEDLINTARMYPGYSLIIIGYSLGAGVSHLVSINLLQNNLLPSSVKLYCIAYGAPPVYRSSNISYSHPNIFNVLHNTDGLPTLSLHNVTKLFLQIRAIDKLKLKRRKILSLLR
ncbi:sn1-specific diacylglycerol lipase beta isoform X2 [Eurytemora carolleeae]|uniref:sn1-specific diacylglycerol lipase beta isoform X2 n=1 Tax=Eurytemora carolleeae TaxID=1294199 RepID=UPI000C77337F|nr:sn1-specific diacylglycerol lipase beta isoform X2 [Eurytemora carolleeae]|eukprot:XP_023327070.1 sn1-specific diacylglycerol lipase beta-like isoform X2 [Eurytemora affinis]